MPNHLSPITIHDSTGAVLTVAWAIGTAHAVFPREHNEALGCFFSKRFPVIPSNMRYDPTGERTMTSMSKNRQERKNFVQHGVL